MKRILTTLALLALTACGQPVGDPSYEIIESSKGVVGKMVTLTTTPSLKSGSLADATQAWQNLGWKKGKSEACKDVAMPYEQPAEAYNLETTGYAPEKIPTRRLCICAAQLSNPKRVAAIGYIVSSEAAQPIKP